MVKTIEIPKKIERQMPKEVPVLSTTDIIKKSMDSKDKKKHCLVGWCCSVFENIDSCEAKGFVINLLHKEIYKETSGKTKSIIYFNDNLATEFCIAKVWNRVMKLLGYTERY